MAYWQEDNCLLLTVCDAVARTAAFALTFWHAHMQEAVENIGRFDPRACVWVVHGKGSLLLDHDVMNQCTLSDPILDPIGCFTGIL